jgi:hypothetical protein
VAGARIDQQDRVNFGRNMGPSSAGAVGWMQFMPDTWLRWGTDGDGDGLADPWDPEDGVFSAARYLAATGGTTDISRAVFAYNHAQWYVDEVLALASVFGGDVDVAFTLDKLAIRLEEAQTAVAETSKALQEAESVAAELQERVRRWTIARPRRTCSSPTGWTSRRTRSRSTSRAPLPTPRSRGSRSS